MNSIIKFGQYIRYHRKLKRAVTVETFFKGFPETEPEIFRQIELGVAAGITFATTDKILFALDSELKFMEF